MSEKYKIRDQDKLYFVTFSVVFKKGCSIQECNRRKTAFEDNFEVIEIIVGDGVLFSIQDILKSSGSIKPDEFITASGYLDFIKKLA